MKSGRGDDSALAAGGPARHVPVLLEEVMRALVPRENGLYLDATFGAGGYARALLARPGARVLALDRDPAALAGGAALVEASSGRLMLEAAQFSALAEVAARLGLSGFDGVTFDVGVSSMQLDEAARGFSFRLEGPLDMRMASSGVSAAELVNEESEERLADILFHYGEERLARRIARAIAAERKKAPFTSTLRLAELVARIVPHKPTDAHPATRTFQALRIAVNDELGELVAGLAGAERVLKPGGRLAVVTFHSLEDRIVKQFFAGRSGRGSARSRLLPGEPAPPEPTFALIERQAITPGDEERAGNPRSRSAKLRWGERTPAPARGVDGDLARLASLPATRQRRR